MSTWETSTGILVTTLFAIGSIDIYAVLIATGCHSTDSQMPLAITRRQSTGCQTLEKAPSAHDFISLYPCFKGEKRCVNCLLQITQPEVLTRHSPQATSFPCCKLSGGVRWPLQTRLPHPQHWGHLGLAHCLRWGCPVHCRMFNSHGFCPLGGSSTFCPQVVTAQCPHALQTPQGGTVPPAGPGGVRWPTRLRPHALHLRWLNAPRRPVRGLGVRSSPIPRLALPHYSGFFWHLLCCFLSSHWLS